MQKLIWRLNTCHDLIQNIIDNAICLHTHRASLSCHGPPCSDLWDPE